MLVVFAGLGIIAAHGQKRGAILEPDPNDTSATTNGKYYALVIGINQYSAPMPQLKTAVNDARAMASLLENRYGFKVTLLLDGQATRQAILNSINKYRSVLAENDSLLIYYGGHGYYDKDADKAYWLPVDAEDQLSANRIIADDLTSDVKALPSRHILIISDSCYSGGLTRGANEPEPTPSARSYVSKQLRIKSRNLMASGGNYPVSDNGPDNHSVFASAVLKGLEQEEDTQFATWDLFFRVRNQVAGNSDQIPQYEPLRNSADDGGDFIFTRKGAHPAMENSIPASSVTTRGVSPAAPSAPASPAVSAPVSIPTVPAASGSTMTATATHDRALALLNNRQFTEAFPLLTSACDGGNANSCTDLGTMYQNGKGVSQDLLQAVAYYRKGCTADAWRGCFLLGTMYSNGTGVGQDPGQAVVFYRRGCEGGDAPSCNSLGLSYANGGGVSKDDVQAAFFFKKACDASGPAACTNLGVAYAKGVGVAQNRVQALALFHKACDLGSQQGCQDVTALNSNSIASAPSPAVAATPAVATPSTAAGSASTLPGKTMTPLEAFNQGLALDQNKQYAAALPLMTFACNGGGGHGCAVLGRMYANGNGIAPNLQQGALLFRKACDGGDPLGCAFLGVAYHEGAGVPKDDGQAAALSLKGCLGGTALGCNDLGFGYEHGLGVLKNTQKAVALYRQACTAGLDQGCQNLRRLQR